MNGIKSKSIENIITEVSKKCFMPLTIGGGIKTIQDAQKRFELGADKITINQEALNDPGFITKLAMEFGSQAVVVSIDIRSHNNGKYVYKDWGRSLTRYKAEEWAYEAQERGAGEILLNSIERDGSSLGYDIDAITRVVDSTSIPVIACGGAGEYSDFAEAVTRARQLP